MLAKDGSYPSGHASLGWAWGLILAEMAPERANALVARGQAFGQSRVICGVHWQSDVTQGRIIGAATVARLHADPVFRAQVDAAGSRRAPFRPGWTRRSPGFTLAFTPAKPEPRVAAIQPT